MTSKANRKALKDVQAVKKLINKLDEEPDAKPAAFSTTKALNNESVAIRIVNRLLEAEGDPADEFKEYDPEFLASLSGKDKDVEGELNDPYPLDSRLPDWVIAAILELREEVKVDSLMPSEHSLKDIDSSDYLSVEEDGGDEEYLVFKDDDAAEEYAVSQLQDSMESEPESFFNPEHSAWVRDFIDLDRIKPDFAREEADNAVENNLPEDFKEKVDFLIEEGHLEKEDFYTLADEAETEDILLADEETLQVFIGETPETQRLLDVGVEKYREKFEADFDLEQFLSDIYGEDWVKEILKTHPQIAQYRKAAEFCVRSDGWAHGIASYDGNSIELPGGAVAARTN